MRALLTGVLLLMLASCTGSLGPAERACRNIAPVVQGAPAAVEILAIASIPGTATTVRVTYRTASPLGPIRQLLCHFSGPAGDMTLTSVETEDGAMGPAQVYFLERFWLRRPGAVAEAEALIVDARPGVWPGWAAYMVQALLNGLPSAAVYSLLAMACALLVGLTGRLNLALGDFGTIGGYAFVAAAVLASRLTDGSIAWVGPGLAAAALTAWAAGLVTARALARSFGPEARNRALLTSLGVAIVIQEGLMIAQGTRPVWTPLPPVAPLRLASGDGFDLQVTPMQIVVVAAAAAAVALALWVVRSTGFGRAWRAVSEDPFAARLMGLDPRRIAAITIIASVMLAGVAGALNASAFGQVHYATGLAMGLKALMLAVVGGVGSIGGAWLAGMTLGLLEALWSAYLPIADRDLAVFVLLSIVLVLRPAGLAGSSGDGPGRA